jgi:hypothetical protein
MSAPVWLIFALVAIQVGVTVYQFRWYRVLRGAAEDAMTVYARIRALEQRDRRRSVTPWAHDPIPPPADHDRPAHMQGDP